MPAALVILAVVVAAQVVTSIMAAEDAKDQAAKEAEAREKAAEIQQQQFDLQNQQQAMSLSRAARASRATIINNAGSNGALTSSSATGSVEAIQSNLSRQLGVNSQAADLAHQATDNTLEQIQLDESRQISQATYSEIGAVFGGIGKLATGGAFDGLGSTTPAAGSQSGGGANWDGSEVG